MARQKRETGGGLPPPPEDGNQGNYPAFLRPSDIGRGKKGNTGTVAFLGEPGRKLPQTRKEYGEQMAFAVKVKGVRYDWPIKLGSPNHRRLHDRFGSKPPKGIVTVAVQVSHGNAYIAIT